MTTLLLVPIFELVCSVPRVSIAGASILQQIVPSSVRFNDKNVVYVWLAVFLFKLVHNYTVTI